MLKISVDITYTKEGPKENLPLIEGRLTQALSALAQDADAGSFAASIHVELEEVVLNAVFDTATMTIHPGA